VERQRKGIHAFSERAKLCEPVEGVVKNLVFSSTAKEAAQKDNLFS
jgi:hypothetical protein